MKEFEIVNKYFKNLSDLTNAKEIELPIGDDCAVLHLSAITDLLITTDTMVAGTHFYADAPPDSIGHKILAVNLSDIAAMGGIPKWCLLNLTLPTGKGYKQEDWLTDFTVGFTKLANKYNVKLIGGDTTSVVNGPISITVTAIGVKSSKILTRSNARNNDGVFITGELGEPAYILELINNNVKIPCYNKLYYPEPRIQAGVFIAQYANAAIDLSDGLLADLGHILQQSNKIAKIFFNTLPCYEKASYNNILAGGDEYEILFTAPMKYKTLLESYTDINISNIGIITDHELSSYSDNIILIDEKGNVINKSDLNIALDNNGWEHFK